MTGYGSARFEYSGVKFLIEIKSVNHRYLKLLFKFPVTLLEKQEQFRKVIGKRISRGSVDVFLRSLECNGDYYSLNKTQVERYREQYRKAFGGAEPSPDSLILLPGATGKSDPSFDDGFTEAIWESFDDAVTDFIESRLGEGNALVENILSHLDRLSELLDTIGKRASLVPKEYVEKLKQRLSVLLDESSLPPDRSILAREMAILADKADISEELVRFSHHIKRFKKKLTEGGPIGKECDFIIQEMNREANTIASKCSDIQISDATITVKSEIEKIREQVQNIE